MIATFSHNRNRLILTVVIAVLALLAIAKLLHKTVYVEYNEQVRDLAFKVEQLEKYKDTISRKDSVVSRDEAVRNLLSSVKSKMMKVSSKSIASAKLQEKIKELSIKAGIEIATYKDLDFREFGSYVRVGGQVVTKCKLRELNNFLYMLENNDTYLTVSEINIKGLNDLQGAYAIIRIYGLADTSSGEM